MTIAALRARLDPVLVDWFGDDEENGGDYPELHLVGLRPGDLVRCFAAIVEHAPRWNDRTFYIEDEDVDVTVAERPEVAELVAEGRAAVACIGAEGMTVEGVELPLVEMFLLAEEIEFFWQPGPAWNDERVAAFFALIMRLLELVPTAVLQPDPRYRAEARRLFGELIARVIDDSTRVDNGGSRP